MKSILKAIFIFALLFCLPFSSTAAEQNAQTLNSEKQTYSNPTYNLRIQFPKSWSLFSYPSKRTDLIQFSAVPPTHLPRVEITITPKDQQGAPTLRYKTRKSGAPETTIDEEGESIINSYTAKMTLAHITDHSTVDQYSLTYYIKNGTTGYLFMLQGDYKNYSEDRKVFDEIMSTMELTPELPKQK
ncbi:hypothetical protein [Anaerospora sp.]|uniref:hypothetical protein n=1 Tax=Anaerospora sp. TaxID=1960278 RepID=UPI0028A27688|nr:hypothetical protein [Anaerospora sp.]